MAENVPNTTENLADSKPETINSLADSTPDNTMCMADSTPDDRQNNDIFSKISILELQKKYGIGRDSLYGRMRYLQITTYKVKGKAYLDADQIVHMDGLHDHIQATGKMEGYPIPEPSGPVEVEETEPDATTTTTTLTVAETTQVTTPSYTPTQKRYSQEGVASRTQSSQVEDAAAIVQSAQNKAAGTLIAENILARHFIENPELLSDELKAKIKESGEMPSIDPFAYADSLINIAMGSISAA